MQQEWRREASAEEATTNTFHEQRKYIEVCAFPLLAES